MVNKKVTATIKDIVSFGAFCKVNIDGEEYSGLIHISEIANEFIRDVNDFLKPGQEVEAVIIHLDEDKKQLKLSIKKLEN